MRSGRVGKKLKFSKRPGTFNKNLRGFHGDLKLDFSDPLVRNIRFGGVCKISGPYY